METLTEEITGSGNKTFSYFNINAKISTESIRSETEWDARDILEDRYLSNWKNEEFTIEVDYKMKEPFRRPLLRLLERISKDTFSVEVSYTYYYYDVEVVEEDDETPPPIPPEDDSFTGLTTYATISQPGNL